MPVLEPNRSLPNPETDQLPMHIIVQIWKAIVLKNMTGVAGLLEDAAPVYTFDGIKYVRRVRIERSICSTLPHKAQPIQYSRIAAYSALKQCRSLSPSVPARGYA
jgi:hypothetical protein